ncbi:GM17361 [Drosophila sechellia]|uniref:GM17361 n=1 Tax=Drosophila sechellia TaxID=7238 RepID=B4I5X2_DROSE|nr:GM17361 [Drosophila sechellia]
MRQLFRRLMNHQYLTQDQINGFDNYKYSAIDTSPLSQYVMHPFWDWLVKFFPRWFAPNLMTFLGFLFSAMNLVLLSYYDWNFEASSGEEGTTPIPSWVWLCTAINIFLAYTLDGIDGKQARRIGLSGPLGELFDHGLDSYTAMLIPTCLYSIFGRSRVYSVRPMRMYYVCLTVYFNFFISHWEKYNTGILYLPWGYDLSMWGSTAMYLVTWWMGFERWKFELPLGSYGTLPLGNVMEAVLHISAMANLPLVIINVYNSYAHRTGRLLSFWEAVRPMWPFITYFCRLIVSQMSVTRCEAWHWQMPMFVLSFLTSLWIPLLERPLLYLLLIVTTLSHWQYGASVVNQMCEHFNRVCFTVHKRVPQEELPKKKTLLAEEISQADKPHAEEPLKKEK